jgi:hypothetical protein
MLGSYGLLASVHVTRLESAELLQAQQEARNIVERITRELRESSPEVIWPSSMIHGESNYVAFFTPRNGNGAFFICPEGEPIWQRSIAYRLDTAEPHTLYRYKLHMVNDPDIDVDSFDSEVVSKNVEALSFGLVNNMLTINIRTFADSDGGIGQVARSHADITTTISLRN